MDILYFNRQIRDELQGARHYVQCAMEIKQSYPQRARVFIDMSLAELNHASSLQKMFEEVYTDTYDHTSDEMFRKFLDDFHSEVVDMYSEEASNIKYMHDMYTK